MKTVDYYEWEKDLEREQERLDHVVIALCAVVIAALAHCMPDDDKFIGSVDQMVEIQE